MRFARLAAQTILALALLAVPLATVAQPSGKAVRLGVLMHGAPGDWSEAVAAFKQRLLELGYIDGANITFEMCWSGGKLEELPLLSSHPFLLLVPHILVT